MNASELASVIHAHFDFGEIGTLCMKLGIQVDDIAGDTRTKRAENLVLYCVRRGTTADLMAVMKKERPNIVWPSAEGKSPEFAQNRTDVLKYSQSPSPQKESTPMGAGEKEVVEQIVRYLMSEMHSYRSANWLVSHREVMETSYTAVATIMSHIELLINTPDLARETMESCQQLSSQAEELLRLLKRMGIGPQSPKFQRTLHNNLFLVDERAIRTAQKLEEIINSYYSGNSSASLSSELRRYLQELKAPTTYTLRWLNYAIDRLDQQTQ